MKPVGDLLCLGCAKRGSARIKTASVPADRLDLRMTLEPAFNGVRTAIFKNIDHSAALQIYQYRAVACSLELAPVVNAHHANRAFSGLGFMPTLQCANNRIVAGCQTKTT